MYNAWDAHYRQVSVLRFTQDSSTLLSGSEDSSVNVWSVSRSNYFSLCDGAPADGSIADYWTTRHKMTIPHHIVLFLTTRFQLRMLYAALVHSRSAEC